MIVAEYKTGGVTVRIDDSFLANSAPEARERARDAAERLLWDVAARQADAEREPERAASQTDAAV